MPVGARPPPLSTRPMMPQKNSTSTVSQPNQLNQFIPPTTNHQPIRQPSSMPPTTMGNRGPMYGRPPPPRTQMTSSSQPPQNRYQSILQQSPNQQNYHIQHTQQSTHSTKMHPSHPQTTTTTTTTKTKTTHVSTSPTPYGKQSFMPTAGGRPPSVIDGRGRGGPPPPSKRGYNGPPSATSNYKGPPTSAPPSTLSPPSGPPPPPPSHKGGRYPPSNAVSTPYNKSSNENNSINRPPTSLTKPRTSRPRKSSKDSRIDPRQIPRPNLPAKETTVDAMYATRTGKGLPPEDCGDYIVEDQGNTNPRILRMSMNSIPRSKDMVVASKIPFRGHVRPFAPLREEDTQVPCLDFGEDGPPRCGRCNGFINPYAKFENNGKTWRCNLCNVSNDVVDPS
jgi:protein transport protein SEC24